MEARKKVLEVLEDQLGPFREPLTDESSFDKLGADSLDKVEMVMELEEAFDISVPDEDMEKMETVGDIIKYLEERLNK